VYTYTLTLRDPRQRWVLTLQYYSDSDLKCDGRGSKTIHNAHVALHKMGLTNNHMVESMQYSGKTNCSLYLMKTVE